MAFYPSSGDRDEYFAIDIEPASFSAYFLIAVGRTVDTVAGAGAAILELQVNLGMKSTDILVQ